MSLLQKNLPFHDQKVVLKDFHTNWDDMDVLHGDEQLHDVSVSSSDFQKCNDVLPVIVYLAGYCCIAIFKKNEMHALQRFDNMCK